MIVSSLLACSPRQRSGHLWLLGVGDVSSGGCQWWIWGCSVPPTWRPDRCPRRAGPPEFRGSELLLPQALGERERQGMAFENSSGWPTASMKQAQWEPRKALGDLHPLRPGALEQGNLSVGGQGFTSQHVYQKQKETVQSVCVCACVRAMINVLTSIK